METYFVEMVMPLGEYKFDITKKFARGKFIAVIYLYKNEVILAGPIMYESDKTLEELEENISMTIEQMSKIFIKQ